MKKPLLIIPITIALAIFFYPTTSNSNSTGSVGGKTGSPTDGGSCTQCHYAGLGAGATITTNIPPNGYVPKQVYTITANIQGSNDQYGFEITSEEVSNFGSAKTGTFFITNNTETKLTNNNKAVTHKLGGTQGLGMKSWSMDWEAPVSGTGAVTFYGAFIEGNMNQMNTGDTYHPAAFTVDEAIISSTNNIPSRSSIIFNSINKTIKLLNKAEISVYNIEGKLVLSSNNKFTSLAHLSNGIYILKAGNKTQKIILN